MIHQFLEQRLQEAVRAILPDAKTENLLVRPCPDPKFGDYQTNALMSVAKEWKINPRQLATDVLGKLDVSELCEKVEIAGAGFLNFRVKTSAIAQTLQAATRGEHLFFQKSEKPRTVVVDFSSPNVAKPMHVGHIRSTILGDSLAKILRTLGHHVITDNHIGDWGTQFGKLLIGWKNYLDQAALKSDPIGEMERLYKLVNAASEQDGKVLESAKEELVKLQSGNEENLRIWREMIELSEHQFDNIYGRLGVKFDHTYGESFYNPWLKETVQELRDKGIAKETEGAIGIFSDDSLPKKEDPFLIQRDGEWLPNPCLIQKSDGAANYATTDLATLKYRLETWNPAEIAYVTDGRQQLHFRQIFAVFARWHPEAKIKLAHVWFGSILGEDGKPLKTRTDKIRISDLLYLNAETFVTQSNTEVKIADLIPPKRHFEVIEWPTLNAEMFFTSSGEQVSLETIERKGDNAPVTQPEGLTVKLSDLLDEAEERAFKIVSEKNPDLSEAERKEIARVIGIGAVKYGDLQQNRQSDYVFSWDKMLSLQGNTAPYLQYAYTRIQSIFRKVRETSNVEPSTLNIDLVAAEEIALAKHLLNFGLTLEAAGEEYRPNYLCSYLYELAGHFAGFYENCPVLKADEAVRNARLALCKLTGDVLKKGLELLGIETVEQM